MVTAGGLINLVAHATIEILLNSLWQGVALAALAWLVLRGMRRANAATRYGFLCATLLALIALPVFNAFPVLRETRRALPSLATESPGPPPEAVPAPVETARAAEETVLAVAPEQHGGRRAEDFAAGEQRLDPKVFGERQGAGVGGAIAPLQSRSWSLEIRLPSGHWLLPLFVVWLLVAAARVGRVWMSFRRLRRFKRISLPLPPEYEQRLSRLAADCRIRRGVRLGGLTDIGVPMVVGLLHPVILFPRQLVEALTEDEFNLILLHELGHVRRWDDWMNLGQKLIEAVFFFHPAVLWVGRRLNLEREIACDDHVISVTQESRHYATCLARLAELTLLPRRASLAPGAVFSKKQIFSRIELLLKRKRDADPHVSKRRLLVPLGVLTMAIIQGFWLAPVIAVSEETFEDSQRDAASRGREQAATKTVTDSTRAAESSHDNVDAERPRLNARQLPGETAVEQLSRPTSIAHAAARGAALADAAAAGNRAAQESVNSRPGTPLAVENRKVERDDHLMASIARMSSSWDKAEALIALLAPKAGLNSVPGGFFEVWKTIPSPMDKTRVLSALLSKRVSKGLLAQTLRAIPVIETESDKAKLLATVAGSCPMDEATFNVYLQVVAVLRSSSDQDQVLSALLERSDLSRNILLRTKALALKKIASTQSRQHVIDKVNLRLAEADRS